MQKLRKKRRQMKKKQVLFHQHNTLSHKSMKTMSKLHEFRYELLPHPPYSPDLTTSDYFRFADCKRILAGKRFHSNDEVIAETEANFEAKDLSHYKSRVEKLENRWNKVY